MTHRKPLEPGGESTYFGPLGIVESYASTCAHCQHITEIPSKRRMMEFVEFCRGCCKLVCVDRVENGIQVKGCAGGPCIPVEKFCDDIERHYQREQMLKMMGIKE